MPAIQRQRCCGRTLEMEPFATALTHVGPTAGKVCRQSWESSYRVPLRDRPVLVAQWQLPARALYGRSDCREEGRSGLAAAFALGMKLARLKLESRRR